MSARDWINAVGARGRAHASKALMLFVGIALGASVAVFVQGNAPEPEGVQPVDWSGGSVATRWTCSMHPQVSQSEPGPCPICGMDLVPVTAANNLASGGPANRVVLSERAQALAKLRTAKVRRQSEASGQLRLLGRFEPNERTLKTVTAWTGGRIDRLQLNVTGQRVRAGQAIATLYSPEVFAAHQDLLVAKRQVQQLQSSSEGTRLAASAALEAARERLRLVGVPDDELVRMEGQGRPTRAVEIRSPYSGTVIERMATEGAYVSTGTPLYRIANLSSLWLQLDAYESDLSRVSVGQSVRVGVQAVPGEEFEGKVTFIDPTLDERLRTARVRVQVGNRDGRLLPGMFAEASVAASEANGSQSPLVVPASAPLFTGRRAIVYVEVEGRERTAYEPRTVRLGPRLGEFYPVVAGLAEGDRVVTRGAFALDADLQIRGGASMMSQADDRQKGAWDGVIELSSAQREVLAPVVLAYLVVQAALADDEVQRAKSGARVLAEALEAIEFKRSPPAEAAWSKVSMALRSHGRRIASARDLEGAREGFEPLSEAIIGLLTQFGNPLKHSVRVAYCPMASGSDGALWVQDGIEIDNSYFGASMLDCGEVRHEVDPAAYLSAPAALSSSEVSKPPAGKLQH